MPDSRDWPSRTFQVILSGLSGFAGVVAYFGYGWLGIVVCIPSVFLCTYAAMECACRGNRCLRMRREESK